MPSIQLWDRLRALFKQSNIYRSDNLFRDQHDLAKVLSGGNIIDFSKQSAILEQTNLQINRLERYKDFDMMDEVGEISLALDTYADESCVTGDTRVPLLDGTCPTIKELAEKGIDNKFWVYSYDIALGKLVPALANGARVSGVNSKIFKVNLDDGMSIRCTGDHLFMLRSGEYRRAMDLKPHDSLMPLYRSKKSSFQEEKPYEFEETVQRRYLEKSFNHKVVSVEDAGIAEKVYDIEVPEYHNFAAGNLNSHVIIHNSLVDAEVKHAVIVKANNSNMKKIIEDFLYDTILIDNQIRPMIRYLCKFGDFISEIIPTKHRDGVSSFRFINVYNFTRIQTKYGDLVGFFYQDPAISGPQFLQPWQVIHMRLTTYDNVYYPYGRCLDTNSRVWTPYGSTALKDIQKGDEVYSFDTAIQKPVITKVLDKVISGVKPTLIIKTKHRAIQVTPEHPVLAIGGVYVLAEDFVIGDEVILPKFHNGIDRGCQWTEYDNCSDDYLVEKIISIEDGGEVEVGDIQVESGYHNFIADGVVIHNSILDGSRKDFKRLRLMEDAALVYRITRSAEKRVFSIPVGNIPPKEVPQYLELIARGFKKHKYVDPATGTLNERYWPTIQDDDFFLPKRCFSVKESIPLLDGRVRTLGQLIDEYGVERDSFWIYSYDKESNRIIPKQAKCVIGPKQSSMIRVSIDDGSHIDCTPDHLFYLNDGSCVQAKDLMPGNSLQPLYRKITKLDYNKRSSNYEQVLQPSGKWEYTHRLYWDGKTIPGVCVHHKDLNSLNNARNNLDLMEYKAHYVLHQTIATGSVRKRRLDPVLDARLRECSRENLILLRTDPKYAKARSIAASKNKESGVRNGIGKLNGTELGRKYAAAGSRAGWRNGAYTHTVGKNHVTYVNLDDYKDDIKELLIKNKGKIRPMCRDWNNSSLGKIWNANKFTIKNKIMEWGYDSVSDFCGIEGNIDLRLNKYINYIAELVAAHGVINATKLWNKDSELRGIWKATRRKISEFAKKGGWQKEKIIEEEVLNDIRKQGSISKFLKITNLKVAKSTCRRIIIRNGYASVKEFMEQPVNHKVVSVEILPNCQDTYCLEVEDTHCFFIMPGVLVHNSDGSGPTIDTLPGAENLDAIADIEYFKKKMVAGLKIPFSRLGIGGQHEPDGKSLAQVSPEFAKSVQWIQNEVIAGLKKLVVVHLALRGHTVGDMRGFDLHMTSASAIDELYRIEAWNTRADIMANLKDIGWFPPEWIISRFTDMSPDEILDLKKIQEKNELSDMLKKENIDPDQKKLIQEYIGFIERSTMGTKDKIIEHNGLVSLINSNELDFLPKPNINGTLAEDGSVKIDDCLVKTNINEDESKEAIKLIKNLLEVSDDVPKTSSVITEEDIAEIDANKSDMIIK